MKMSEQGLNELLSVADAIRVIDSVPIAASAIRHVPPHWKRAGLSALREDVVSDRDYPPFDKALMDGFAVRSADFSNGPRDLELVGEVAAGGNASIAVPSGTCVAIMTGAAVPSDADAVLPVEISTTIGTRVHFSKAAKVGEAISKRAADLREGQIVLTRRSLIGPAQIGALVQVGAFSSVPTELFRCESSLTAHVLVTGDEIVGEADTPGPSQMRDVNGPMLAALLAAMDVRCGRSRVIDDEDQTREAIDRLVRENDILCVTGGMSMGKYDYVPKALIDLGFELKITKLKIKPGKPFVFATRERGGKTDYVFGLPGNPVSGFCCTVRLASRLIARLQGRSPTEPQLATLESALPTNGPREFYQPAVVNDSRVTPLGWKGSADVFTLARANALIVRPVDDRARAIGEEISIMQW